MLRNFARAERAGAFVRSPTLWARLRSVRHVIFDKTGTLTLERPVLVSPDSVTSLPDGAALALARLTAGSLHPIGRTLLEALGARGQRLLSDNPHFEILDHPGQGVSFEQDDHRSTLGKAGWSGDSSERSTSLCRDGERLAAFQFRDTLRPGTGEALSLLRARRHKLWILSGDTEEKVAKKTEAPPLESLVKDVYFEVPDTHKQQIEEVQKLLSKE